ncbi:LCP family protein [Streptomyces sp. NPDC060194]|uniref:LCP family protein n=1 Tax=Streptomyces sp. NPDC060194 TaxID=3347069 RepID=UPI00365F3743
MSGSSVRPGGPGGRSQAGGRRGGTAAAQGGRRAAVPRQRTGAADGDPPGISRADRRKQGRPPRKRVLRMVAIGVAAAVLGTAGAGYLWWDDLNSRLQKAPLTAGGKMAEHKANAAGQTPMNILLIGSDARDNKANQKLGGARSTFGSPPLADVQMLLHLSADRSNISVVSMPRDTLIPRPECRDPEDDGKVYEARQLAPVNEAIRYGGPGCVVATWSEFSGVPIDHFMMIKFDGVVSMADAIGGVPVCVTANIESRNRDGGGSGLKLEEGTTKVKGEQALQWLRTRYGFGDNSDVGRTRAQHMYMNSMVRELRENATLTNPGKLKSLAETAMDAFTVDDGIDGVLGLVDIAQELRKVEPERITMTTMPNANSQRSGVYQYKVEPIPGDAEDLFEMIRDDVPLDAKPKKKTAEVKESDDPAAAPAEIPVQVVNGTGTASEGPASGRARDVTALLAAKGFTAAEPDTTPGKEARTTVVFPSADLEGDAQAVAKALGLPLSAVKGSEEASGITLTVGADWRTGDVYKAPKAKKTPKTANALNGAKEDCMEVNPNYTW